MNEAVKGRRIRLRPPAFRHVSVLYLLALIVVIFGCWVPETFMTQTTWKLIGGDQVVVAVIALAILLPLKAGVFDLSAGAMVGFSLAILSALELHTHMNVFFACVIAMASCVVVGCLSGFVVVKLHVSSFIATLGMSQVLGALTLLVSSNQQIVGVFSKQFLHLGRAEPGGVPVVIYYLAVLAAILWYVLEWTPLGRRIFATGANPTAARLAGVSTDRIVWGSLVASAAIAGFAGLVYGAKIGTFDNSLGPPLLFPAFAGVFLGSTQFSQRPNVWGTILSLYALAAGVKGLQLAFQSGTYWITPLFNGVALLIAVAAATRTVPAMAGRLRFRRRKQSAEPGSPESDQGREEEPEMAVPAAARPTNPSH